MKLTDVHTNLHLTLTALQFPFSSHSVSVITVTFRGSNTITTAVTVRSPSPTNETLTANGPISRHPHTNDALETVPCGGTSGVFLHYCSWHGSMTVCAYCHTDGRERRWVRVSCNVRTVLLLHCLRHTSCRITPRFWITSSHPGGWVGHESRLAVAW